MSAVDIAELGVDPSIISQKPDVVSGTPVFPRTRVSVSALLDYMVGGEPLDRFLYNYPEVTREQAVKVIELAFERIIGSRDEAL